MFSDRDIAVGTAFAIVAIAITAIGEMPGISETQDGGLTLIGVFTALMIAYRLGKGSS